MLYQYECDTCSQNHTIEFQTMDDAQEFIELWESEGFKVWSVTE